MRDWILAWPDDLISGYKKAESLHVTESDTVVFWGMGGSGIVGKIFSDVANETGKKPVFSGGGYGVPDWICGKTLFIPVSYSGNTEETLESFEKALAKKANVLPMFSGGKLGAESINNGLLSVKMQSGRAPRANLPEMIGIAAALCEKSGVLPSMEKMILDAASAVERLLSERKDEMKELAQNTAGAEIYAVSSEKIKSVSTRWACQINENAKKMAEALWLPEMNHNFVVGGVPRDAVFIYLVQVCLDKPGSRKRRTATSELMKESSENFKSFEILFTGNDYFSSYMEALAFGDLYSTYLAETLEIDPLPITAIDKLKSLLGGERKQ